MDVNQPLPWVFTRWSRADSLPVSRALGRTSRFCNTLLQDLAPLHIKTTRSTEFVECLSEETQIIDLFTNCNLQLHKLSQCTLATRLKSSLWAGEGGKLWLWKETGCECFWKVTKFFFENSLHSEETLSLVGVISFVSLNLYFLVIRRPRLTCFHTINK